MNNKKDSGIQKFIYQKYKQYELSKKNYTIKELCDKEEKKEEINFTSYQKFLQEYVLNMKNKGILLFHNVGSGKTLTSITMAKNLLDNKKVNRIFVLLPASLKNNYNTEIKKIYGDLEIYPFTLVSYNANNVIDNKDDFNDSLVIIDEVQNLISGIYNKAESNLFIRNKLKKSNCKIIALSATPVVNSAYEYAILFNILNNKSMNYSPVDFKDKFLDSSYRIKNKDIIYNEIKGLASYYQGVNETSEVFPKTSIKEIKLIMKKKQEDFYHEAIKEDKIGTAKEIIFGNEKKIGTFRSYGRKASNSIDNLQGNISLSELEQYSIKLFTALKLIKASKGPVLVYSNFVVNTLLPFKEILENNGIVAYLWTGNENNETRKKTLSDFNNISNKNKNIVLLTSKSGTEGLSLKNIRQVHIIEPHWNNVRIKQVIGRAVRMCSHSSLPVNEQLVKVFIYLAYTTTGSSTDKHIYTIAEQKLKIIDEFENMIKISALDCQLNINQNTSVKKCYEYMLKSSEK